MSYHAPDLSGTDPSHAIINDVRAVFRKEQKLSFVSAVFADSFDISVVGTVARALLFVKDVDWTVKDDDIDYDTMSRVKVMDPTFTKTLVKSITIIHPFTDQYNLNLNYQQFYPNQIRTALYADQRFTFTPELALGILQKLDQLELQQKKSLEVSTPQSTETKLLEEDLDKSKPTNFIAKEVHTLDTVSGVVCIQPVFGAFYADSVVITHPVTQKTLEQGKDYYLVGMDVPKTKATVHTAPVYTFICFTIELVGDVEVSYHAFGGAPSLTNFREVLRMVQNTSTYTSSAIDTLDTRIQKMEDYMRRFLSGTPSYGDTGNGTSRLYKVTAVDSKLHWWTVGSLYKVDGSNDIVNADRMHLRVSMLQTKCMFDAFISVNLNNPEYSKFRVEVASESYPRGYVPFKDYSMVDQLVRPQFRILWNSDATAPSGVILQIGMPLKRVLTESICLEDFSGMECCWKLRAEQATAIMPEDTLIPLPATNEASEPLFVWSQDNPKSLVESTLVPFKQGYLAYVGQLCLNQPGGWQHYELEHILEDDIDYRRVTKVRLELSERNSYCFPVDIEVTPGLDDIYGTTTRTYYREAMDFIVHMSRDPLTKALLFTLDSRVTEDVGAAPLDLKSVLIYV